MASIRYRADQQRRHQVRWRSPDGLQRTKSFFLKRDALEWKTSLERDLYRGTYVDPNGGRIHLNEWADQWLAGRVGLRASSLACDRSYVKNLVIPDLGDLPLSKVTSQRVRIWVGDLVSRGSASATVQKAHQILSNMFSQAVEDGLLVSNPCVGVELPKVEHYDARFLTPVEIMRLSLAIDTRYQALVLTAAYGGLRWGEASALRVDRLDFDEGALAVEETLGDVDSLLRFGPPKTAASRRRVALPRQLTSALQSHIERHPPDASGLIFQAPQGGPIRRASWRQRFWLPAVRSSVGQPCRFHDLRHTHAALLIAGGEHPKVIQSRLGHSTIATTLNTYGHLFDGIDQEAASRLEERIADSNVAVMWPESKDPDSESKLRVRRYKA